MFRNITETCGKNVSLVKIGEKWYELNVKTYKVQEHLGYYRYNSWQR
jgi:hypothetical protein